MRRTKTCLPKDALHPFYGLNTAVPSQQLGQAFSPNCKNVEFRKNVIEARRGSMQLGNDVEGTPIGEISFISDSGLPQSILVTTTNQYKYSSGEWDELYQEIIDDCSSHSAWTGSTYVTPSTITGQVGNAVRLTVTGSFTTGKLVYHGNFSPVKDIVKSNALSFWFRSSIALNAEELSIVLCEDAAGAKTGTYVELKLPTIAANTWTKVHISGGFSLMDELLSFGVYQNVDLAAATFDFDSIRTICVWTGDEEDWLDSIDGTDDNGRYLFLTNGKNRPLVWNGTSVEFFYPENGLSNFETCRTFAMFYGALVLGNLTIDGVIYQNSVAYSTVGATVDFFDFSSVGSDLVLITDASGPIIRILPFSDRLIIYTSSSIVMVTFVGGDEIYSTQLIVKGSSQIISGRAIANLGFAHIYMAQDVVHLFDGTSVPREVIGFDRISNLYRNIIDYATFYNAFCFYDDIRQCIFFGIPTSSDSTRIFLADFKDFNFTEQSVSWTEFEYAERITFMSHFKEMDSLTWDSLNAQIPWEGCFFSWDDASMKEGFPVAIIGTTEGVYVLNKMFSDDDGTSIDAFYDFPDLTSPEFLSMNGRFLEVEFEGFGRSVDIYYSTNEGGSWKLIDTQLLTVSSGVYKLFLDITAKSIRFRLRGNYYFCVRWLRVWAVLGGM